jgi:hypothetical protein
VVSRRARTLIPLALVGYLAMLGSLALFLSRESFLQAFVEGGVFEWVSLILWLTAGIAAFGLLSCRISRWLVISLLIVLLACAAREADLHNALTGYSVLKIGYYIDGEHPLPHRIAFGGIILLLVAALVRLGLAVVNHVRVRNGALRSWELSILLGLATMVLTKVADRAPAVAEKAFGLSVSDGWRHYLLAFEEGSEALVPLFALSAMGLFVHEHARLRRSERGPEGDESGAYAPPASDESPDSSAASSAPPPGSRGATPPASPSAARRSTGAKA